MSVELRKEMHKLLEKKRVLESMLCSIEAELELVESKIMADPVNVTDVLSKIQEGTMTTADATILLTAKPSPAKCDGVFKIIRYEGVTELFNQPEHWLIGAPLGPTERMFKASAEFSIEFEVLAAPTPLVTGWKIHTESDDTSFTCRLYGMSEALGRCLLASGGATHEFLGASVEFCSYILEVTWKPPAQNTWLRGLTLFSV